MYNAVLRLNVTVKMISSLKLFVCEHARWVSSLAQ